MNNGILVHFCYDLDLDDHGDFLLPTVDDVTLHI